MRLRLTHKDLLLILGIAVAIIITISALFSHNSLFTVKPNFSKKIVAANKAAVSIQKQYQLFFGGD